MKKGDIDAIAHLDPVIAKLEADGDIAILYDTRTEAGTRDLFGGSNPAACLYLKNDFIAANPNTVQALVNAHYKALKFLEKATPDQVADAVPPEFHLGERGLYTSAFTKTREAYSRTGIFSADGMKSVADMLKAIDTEMATATVDLSKTQIASFAEKAAGLVK
jgi:NitT/TauT family transport system substrate-binding protein